MKRLIVAILILILISYVAISICGCATVVDDESFTAIIKLPDGTIVSGTVEEYTRWSDSNIKIKINGVTYYAHPANVTLTQGE